ncbi:ABC transporter ATP-binding protein [Paenibacillus sp. GSMTC-2017]|uniref:ABC transporter ATP-binding protein n=1 Tax=Paenibacillus sp. GSMTC-2017 TaxID=2794350 RepID=UPI0018D5D340|nr:ABC transporter ATP-binding protein [Paenibacillus sp. GSMTC-2017]MBH5318893.1 ABC transporter ATP-binding protein [Paenibacillus sp. GSMTC-2017]
MQSNNRLSATPKIRELVPMLWNRLGSNRLWFIIAILFCLSDLIINMMIPIVLETYFNILEDGDLKQVQTALIIFNVLLLALTGLGLLGHYLKQNNMSKLHRAITLELVDHTQRLPLEKSQASHSADLSQRIMWDSSKVTTLLVTIFNNMGTQIFMLILACLYMLTLQWQVTAGIMLLMPFGLIGSHLLRHRLQRIGKEVADAEGIFRQCQQDALQSMDTLRAFDAENWMMDRFIKQRNHLNKLYMRRMWLQQLVNVLTTTLALFISWGSILAVAWLAVEGKLQLGALMAFFILIWRVYDPLLNLGRLWGEIQESKGAAARIASIWRAKKEPSEEVDVPQTVAYTSDMSVLTWNRVSFQYEQRAGIQEMDGIDNVDAYTANKQLLNDFEFSLGPSSFTAIVGTSGSGKSTVAKLGAGLLFPIDGSVNIYGTSSLINAELARQNVSYVPQNPYLFSGTIRDNLLMAMPHAQEADLIKAAKIAEAHTFIEALPDGYDTRINEHGNSLSGGQKQRLAIARAVLADRPIWIFDEATSALDLETERRVMAGILSRIRERSSSLLVIAHRLTTVQEADVIVAMESGVIKEQGSHRELLQREGGIYRKLWQQMEGSEAVYTHSG